jgi:dipeptidyl aminopeptidase/acylaminoacyl peptidase
MQPADVLSRPARPPDLALRYGPEDEVADLWLPPGGTAGPARFVLFLHGGFWRAAYDRRHAGPLAEALSAAGLAVCVPEYRRVGQPGGGWPGTFDDVAAAVRGLPALVGEAAAGRVTTDRMVLAGHSAGGHLALWAAAQEIGLARPDLLAVVSLAGVCDLAACHRLRLGQDAAGELMGGGPEELPERYLRADPMAAIPVRASVILVHGLADDRVPWQQSGTYATAASAAGGEARCVLLPDAGHFDVIDPLSPTWPAVQAEFLSASGLSHTS